MNITARFTKSNDAYPLYIALAGTAILLFLPYAGFLTYPFLIFSTFIHETFHALAAVATWGDVDSMTLSLDGSGLTHTRGGIRVIVSSAGYLGTAVFGAMLCIFSMRRKLIRAALAGCAALVALITAFFAGHANNAIVLIGLFLTFGLLAAARQNSVSRYRTVLLLSAAGLASGLVAYHFLTGSLFSWSVGLVLSVGLILVSRFASQRTAQLFLSFLAVQCSLNSLLALKYLFTASINGACTSDAKNMEVISGIPAVFWALLWMVIAVFLYFLAFKIAVSSTNKTPGN